MQNNELIKQMLMKHCFYAIAAALICVAACQKEEKEDTLEISSSSFVVTSAGASQTINFKTNTVWTISSDKKDWVSFDTTSGEAGEVSVSMTVSPNETYDARTATVTVTAGKKLSKINVSQAGKSEFSTAIAFNISYEAQDISVSTRSNVEYSVEIADDAKEWLSVVKTKGEPESGEILLHAAANTTADERVGAFVVYTADGSFSQSYSVKQTTQYKVLTTAEGFHLGRVQRIYNSETWAYTSDNQFAIVLSNDNSEEVTLVLNADSLATSPAAGEYAVDATGEHANGTFSLKSTDGHEKYYTKMVSSGSETAVYDGTVNIEVADGVYTIVAMLSDASENIHSYYYQGAVSFADKTFGAQVVGAQYMGIYDTYFTTKANRFSVPVYISKAAADGQTYLSYVSVTLYTSAGNINRNVLPEGTYSYAVPENDASLSYSCGTVNATPGTFYFYASTEAGNSVEPAEGSVPTFEIKINENGNYDITLKGKFNEVKTEYDEDWNESKTIVSTFDYNGVFADVYAEVTDGAQSPVPDGNDVFNDVFNSKYVAMWFGNKFDAANHLFVTGFTNINNAYTVYLALNVKGDWTFEKNFANRFCSTPFHTGTFNFSSTAADDALLPIKYNNQDYCYVLNGYTGTKMVISGGSVTITDTTIEYNLKATTPDGQTYSFTGSHPATFYYARDYSAQQSRITLPTE